MTNPFTDVSVLIEALDVAKKNMAQMKDVKEWADKIKLMPKYGTHTSGPEEALLDLAKKFSTAIYNTNSLIEFLLNNIVEANANEEQLKRAAEAGRTTAFPVLHLKDVEDYMPD